MMKIFLSHAIADVELITRLKRNCNLHGLQLLIAEHTIDVNKTITEKIEEMIKESHIALFLLTENGSNSDFVKQEIGYAQALKKPALYIVQKGQKIKGFNYGNDFIELDPIKPHEAIKKSISVLLHFWKKIQEVKKEEERNAALLFGGLIAFALLANSD